MRKRSQIQGMVILWLIVGVIAVSAMLFGYKVIKNFQKSGEETMYMDFEKAMDEGIAVLKNKFRATHEVKANIPSHIKEICFVDPTKTEFIFSSPKIKEYPYIKDSIGSNSTQNIFFLSDRLERIYSYPEIIMDQYPYFYCQPTDGRIDIYLEARGRNALLMAGIKKSLKLETPTKSLQELESYDLSARLRILPGTSVTSSGIIVREISLAPEFIDLSRTKISDTYAILPRDGRLSSEAKIIFKYPPEQQGEMAIYHMTDSGWEKSDEDYHHDETMREISVSIQELGYYVLADSSDVKGSS
ncbi:hypothetical protein JW968_06055 [Candidatus Woesearchaeota archaeon]|nr:hypothetical protein [Candidatus Woesearchaeota archaeon]